MNKDNVIGIILIAITLIGFSWYNANQEKKLAQTEVVAPETSKSPASTNNLAAKVAKQVDSTQVFFSNAKGENKDIVLHNNKIRVTLQTKGGVIREVRLNEFKSYKDFVANKNNPLLLYSADNASLDMNLDLKDENISFSDYYFEPVNQTDSTVTLRLKSASGAQIDLNYALLPDNYLVNLSLVTSGLSKYTASSTRSIQVDWKDKVAQHEKGFYFENMYSTLTYKLHNDDTEKLSESQTEEESVTEGVDWVAFKNQYFSAILIAAQPFKDVSLKSVQLNEDGGYLKDYQATMSAAYDRTEQTPSKFQFYFGPNNYRLLQSLEQYKITTDDYDLQTLVYLGWPIVRLINRYFTLYVFDFLTKAGLPMGIVLLLITILLRVIVYVPTRKSFMSSAKMRVLKPKADEIAAKYPKKEDQLVRQQQIMSMYSQYGASAMGGCLPMLIQMPIWIAMFNFVPNAIELRQQSFLWAEDLSTYDSLISWDYNLWGIGNHISLFCLLFCLANLAYSWLTMRQQRESSMASNEMADQMKIMQWMMMLMPLFFFFMFNKYSAGLNYYYFLSLLLSAITMWWLRYSCDDAKLLAKLEAYYEANKNNPQKKQGGLAARLAALQQQQEEMLKKQQEQRQRK